MAVVPCPGTDIAVTDACGWSTTGDRLDLDDGCAAVCSCDWGDINCGDVACPAVASLDVRPGELLPEVASNCGAATPGRRAAPALGVNLSMTRMAR